MVEHTFNPSTGEAEAGGSLFVQGQPDLPSETCLKQTKKQTRQIPSKTTNNLMQLDKSAHALGLLENGSKW